MAVALQLRHYALGFPWHLVAGLLVAHGVGVLAWLSLPQTSKWAAVGGLFVSCASSLRWVYVRRPLVLGVGFGGVLTCTFGDGGVLEGKLLPSTRLLGGMVFLDLLPLDERAKSTRPVSVLCTRDMFQGGDWYGLLRWLRYPPP